MLEAEILGYVSGRKVVECLCSILSMGSERNRFSITELWVRLVKSDMKEKRRGMDLLIVDLSGTVLGLAEVTCNSWKLKYSSKWCEGG